MKTSGRQSKNIIDKRGRRPESSIVGIAKRNADAVQWMKAQGQIPDKVKKDMGNALTYMRRNSAVKQTRDRLPLEQAREIMKKRSNKKQDRVK